MKILTAILGSVISLLVNDSAFGNSPSHDCRKVSVLNLQHRPPTQPSFTPTELAEKFSQGRLTRKDVPGVASWITHSVMADPQSHPLESGELPASARSQYAEANTVIARVQALQGDLPKAQAEIARRHWEETGLQPVVFFSKLNKRLFPADFRPLHRADLRALFDRLQVSNFGEVLNFLSREGDDLSGPEREYLSAVQKSIILVLNTKLQTNEWKSEFLKIESVILQKIEKSDSRNPDFIKFLETLTALQIPSERIVFELNEIRSIESALPSNPRNSILVSKLRETIIASLHQISNLSPELQKYLAKNPVSKNDIEMLFINPKILMSTTFIDELNQEFLRRLATSDQYIQRFAIAEYFLRLGIHQEDARAELEKFIRENEDFTELISKAQEILDKFPIKP